MRRWAQMSGAVCANVVEQDAAPTFGGEWLDVTGLPVGPGNIWDGSAWLAPVADVADVASVTPRQARLALLAINKLDALEAAIDALPEPVRTRARLEWDYTSEIRRDNELLLQIAPLIGLSAPQLDAMFASACTL